MFLGNDENLLPPPGWVCLSRQRLLKGTLRPELPSLRRHESKIPSGGGHVQTTEGVKRRLTDVFRERRKFIAADGVGLSFQATPPEWDVATRDAVLRHHESTIPSGGGVLAAN